MTHEFRREHVPTSVSLNSSNFQLHVLRVFAMLEPGFVAFFVDMLKPMRCVRLLSETRVAALDPSISNELHHQLLVLLDHSGAPTS